MSAAEAEPLDEGNLGGGWYGRLSQPDVLQAALDRVTAGFDAPHRSESFVGNTDSGHMICRRLRSSLRNKTYMPAAIRLLDDGTFLKEPLEDAVVRSAIKATLARLFPRTLEVCSDPVGWLTGVIERGLTRAHVFDLSRSFTPSTAGPLLERIGAATRDLDFVGLVSTVLASLGDQPETAANLLSDVAYTNIDRMLGQASSLARGQLEVTRVGNEVAILAARKSSTNQWVLHATLDRFRSEATRSSFSPALMSFHFADLSANDSLPAFGYVFRRRPSLWGRLGRCRIEANPADTISPVPKSEGAAVVPLTEETPEPKVQSPLAPRWKARRAHWVRPEENHDVGGAQGRPRKSGGVLKWLLARVARVCPMSFNPSRRTQIKSSLVMKALANSKRNILIGMVFVGWFAAMYFFLYTGLSSEWPRASIVPGFYEGRHNRGNLFDPTWTDYGLYVPPHLMSSGTPRPLIVFLHGYGERSMDKLFTAGLPLSIERMAVKSGANPFPFVAVFPIDPTGQWDSGTLGIDAALHIVEYVVSKHNIDVDRIYVTGLSNGGSGVWRLAEADPLRWAALAPVSSFHRPDVGKIRDIPAWLFHGEEDKLAPVQSTRELVTALRAAKADVQYTEYKKQGHLVWRQTYDEKVLYEWLATKRRR